MALGGQKRRLLVILLAEEDSVRISSSWLQLESLPKL